MGCTELFVGGAGGLDTQATQRAEIILGDAPQDHMTIACRSTQCDAVNNPCQACAHGARQEHNGNAG